jgi:hypothetical protein
MHHAKESMKKNPRKFSEGSLLLKMTRQKGTISIFIAEIE